MALVGNLIVKLTASITNFERQMTLAVKKMKDTEKAFNASAQRMESAGQSLLIGLTAPLALIGGSAINMAMDAIESENLFSVAMGDMANSAREFSEQLRSQLGLNVYEVRNNIATLYDMTKAMGLSKSEAYELSTNLTQLSYDLASFKNLRTEDAFYKLRAGITGETEPLKAIGILVDDTTIKHLALRKGLIKQGQEMSQQQKVLMRYVAIMEQTKTAQGDLARTLDSPKNQLRLFQQALKEAQTNLGFGFISAVEGVLPYLTKMARGLSNAAKAFQQLNPQIRNLVATLVFTAIAIGPMLIGLSIFYKLSAQAALGMRLLAAFSGRASFAFAAWRGGATKLGEALIYVFGTKTKLIIAGILGIAAVTALLAANWHKFAGAAKAIWNTISAAVLYAASLVVRGVGAIISVLSLIIPSFRGAADAVMGYADKLKQAAASSISMAKTGAPAITAAKAIQQTATAAQNAAQSQQQMGDAVKNAAKQAGKGIQSFDEVHQIEEAMAGAGEEAAAALQNSEMPSLTLPGIGGAGMLGDMSNAFTDMGKKLSDAWNNTVTGITTAWANLKAKALETFPWLKTVIEVANVPIKWIKDNWPTIGPIVEDIAGLIMLSLVPAFIKTGVEATIAGAKVVASWAAQGLAAVVNGAKMLGQFLLLIPKWALLGIQATVNAGKVVLAWAMQGWQAAASAAVQVGQFAILVAKWIWLGVQSMVNAAKVAAAWLLAMGPIPWVIAAVVGLVALIIKYWDEIKATTEKVWGALTNWLSQKWEGIKNTANTVWSFITSSMGGFWDKIKNYTFQAWDNISGRLATLWNGIKDTAGRIWSGIIDAIKTPINHIIQVINKFLDALSRIKISVPEVNIPLVGKVGGFTIGFPSIPKIPMLAEGGIVTGPTLAMIGERGDEAVVPLSRGGFAEELASTVAQAVYAAVRDAMRISLAEQKAGNGGNQELVLQVDSTKLARVLIPAITKEGQRIGSPVVLVQGG